VDLTGERIESLPCAGRGQIQHSEKQRIVGGEPVKRAGNRALVTRPRCVDKVDIIAHECQDDVVAVAAIVEHERHQESEIARNSAEPADNGITPIIVDDGVIGARRIIAARRQHAQGRAGQIHGAIDDDLVVIACRIDLDLER